MFSYFSACFILICLALLFILIVNYKVWLLTENHFAFQPSFMWEEETHYEIQLVESLNCNQYQVNQMLMVLSKFFS